MTKYQNNLDFNSNLFRKYSLNSDDGLKNTQSVIKLVNNDKIIYFMCENDDLEIEEILQNIMDNHDKSAGFINVYIEYWLIEHIKERKLKIRQQCQI
jgi:hypothetical protein